MASAYIADIIPSHQRATFFSVFTALISFSRIGAAALAGLFDSFVATTFLALLCCFAAMLVAAFVLPETLPTHERKPFSWSDRAQLAEVL